MRQRKYRGYTNLIGHPSGMVYGSGCFIDQGDKHYVISDETGKPDFIQVKEIEDWTNLLDKHGKEIYEGDVVRTTTDEGSEKETPAGVYFKNGMYFRGGTALFWNEAYTGYLEIIGNIYENPELLSNQ